MALSAHKICATCYYFLLSKEKQTGSTARAVANGGRIPIARRLLADRTPCGPHLGSDPYWRIDAHGGLGATSIPGRDVRPASGDRGIQRDSTTSALRGVFGLLLGGFLAWTVARHCIQGVRNYQPGGLIGSVSASQK